MEAVSKSLTRPDYLRQFWTLVRLRYRLIWAQARTSNSKIALLFALYLLGGFSALSFYLGGFGAAIAGNELEQSESVARWMLLSLFVSGIGLSLLFGLGAREAFSEGSLRRYPLNSQQRFAVRHMIGLLDPTWMILITGVIGLLVGFWWLGKGSIITGLPATFLFIASNYLATAVLLSLIGLMLRTRFGSALLGAAVLLLVSFGPLVLTPILADQWVAIWLAMDYVVQLTPPGVAAAMIVGSDWVKAIGGAGLLLLWCGALIYALLRIEKRPLVSQTMAAGNVSWDNFYDQIGNLFGRKYGPLVSKSLRYHLRCNLVRFSLITSPIIVLMIKFLVPGQGPNRFFLVSLTMFFILSSATGAALMLNILGYDDAGIRRYALLPVPFADALRAGSFASLLLRTVTVIVAFALWLVVYGGQSVTWEMIVMILSIAFASLFLFNALGLWTSIFSPKSLNFDALWNTRLSFGAQLVIVTGFLIPMCGMMIFAGQIDQHSLSQFWWITFLILLLCIGFYAFSLRIIERLLKSRRERLVNLIAGARDK